jgi:Glyoxalase-like domain
MRPMRLDHLSYAAGPERLAACVQRLGAALGAGFQDGGLHPAFGTRNFILPLRNDVYLEVIGVLDHPAVEGAAFRRAVKARAEAGGGWLGWAVRVEDIAPLEARFGRPAVDGHRRRPDGFDLRWRQLGIDDLASDLQVPFSLQWLTSPDEHPSQGGRSVTLTGLEIAGDEATVDGYLAVATNRLLDGIAVEWTDPSAEDTGIIAATFETARGTVRID